MAQHVTRIVFQIQKYPYIFDEKVEWKTLDILAKIGGFPLWNCTYAQRIDHFTWISTVRNPINIMITKFSHSGFKPDWPFIAIYN